MTNRSIDTAALRSRAEAFLADRPPGSVRGSEGGLKRTLHEMQVYQVELEIQQEELLQANRNLALLRDEYRDLFEFSPVGYFKLPQGSDEMLMNLTLLTLLNLPTDSRVSSLSPYIDDSDRCAWADCLQRLRLGEHRGECALQLRPAGGLRLFAKVLLTQFDTLHRGAILGVVVPISEDEYRSRKHQE